MSETVYTPEVEDYVAGGQEQIIEERWQTAVHEAGRTALGGDYQPVDVSRGVVLADELRPDTQQAMRRMAIAPPAGYLTLRGGLPRIVR